MATTPASGARAWNALVEVTGDTKEKLLELGFTDDYANRLEAEGYTKAELLKAATFERLVDAGLLPAHACYVCSRGLSPLQPGGGAAGVAGAQAGGAAAADATADASRAAVLEDLLKLAVRYQEIDLSKFLDGTEELLHLGLGDVSPIIPVGLRSDILFRVCYAGVLEIIRAFKKQDAAVFTGTPGVGKSAAALFIACDLANKQRRFVHRSTNPSLGEVLVYMDFTDRNNPRVDYTNQRDSANFARLSGCLADPDTLLIWDGNLPRGQYSGDRAYVVLSSPNEDNFSDFIKGGVAVYCIDTWSLPEILKALPLYPCVTRETVVERYRWFGGTVRDVLANAHVPGNTFRLKVEKVLSAKDLDHLCSLSFEGTSSDLKHRFAHYRAGPDMLFSKMVIASPAIRQLAYRKNVDVKKRNVRQMVLSGAAGESAYAGYRGSMLEEVGHEKLPGALKVKIQPAKQPTRAEALAAAHAALKAATPTEAGVAIQAAAAMEQGCNASAATASIIRLRRSKRLRAAPPSSRTEQVEEQQMVEEMEAGMEDHHILSPPEVPEEAAAAPPPPPGSMEEDVQLSAVQKVWDYPGLDIQDMPEYYLQPTTTNNAAWDAVRKCPQHLWILQYTISEWHGTKAQAILDLLARFSLEDRKRAVLVFAVPGDVYSGYLQQPWLTVGKRLMTNVPEELRGMPQMVLKMPLGDEDSRGSSEGGGS